MTRVPYVESAFGQWRRPDADERRILDRLLAGDEPGFAELRAQASTVLVRRDCWCGCPSVSLIVAADAPTGAVLGGGVEAIPAASAALDAGSHLVVFLHVADGRLEHLDQAEFADTEPRRTWVDISDYEISHSLH